MSKLTSKLQVSVNGRELGIFNLEDNPADHRGALSWIHDLHMYEPDSYGYLIDVATLKTGKATIRLTVPESAVSDTSGGLAIYGKEFGRYTHWTQQSSSNNQNGSPGGAAIS